MPNSKQKYVKQGRVEKFLTPKKEEEDVFDYQAF
jgi:hypothetical protein